MDPEKKVRTLYIHNHLRDSGPPKAPDKSIPGTASPNCFFLGPQKSLYTEQPPEKCLPASEMAILSFSSPSPRGLSNGRISLQRKKQRAGEAEEERKLPGDPLKGQVREREGRGWWPSRSSPVTRNTGPHRLTPKSRPSPVAPRTPVTAPPPEPHPLLADPRGAHGPCPTRSGPLLAAVPFWLLSPSVPMSDRSQRRR